MPLDKQLIGIDFIGGLDTKTDEKLLEPPFLTLLENGEFTRGGSVRKRNGYQPLTRQIFNSSETITEAIGLSNFDDELLILTSDYLYSYSENSADWVEKGRNEHFELKRSKIVSNDDEQRYPSIGTCKNVTAWMWTDSRGGGTVRTTVIDNITGTDYISDDEVYNGNAFSLGVGINDTIVFLLGERGGGDLLTVPINCAGPPNVPGPIIYDPNLAPGAHYDFDRALALSFQPKLFTIDGGIAVWINTVGEVSIGYVTESGTKGAPVNGFPAEQIIPGSAGASNVSVNFQGDAGANGLICVAIVTAGTSLRAVILEPDLTTVVRDVVISTDATILADSYHIGIAYADPVFEVYIDSKIEAQNEIIRIYQGTVDPTPGPPVPTTFLLKKIGGTLAAKPLRQGNRTLITAIFHSNAQFTNFMFDGNDGTVHGRWLYGLAYAEDYPPNPGVFPELVIRPLPQQPLLRGEKYVTPAMEKSRIRTTGVVSYTPLGISETTIDFSAPRPDTEQVDRNTLFAGPIMKAYDGASLVELGFLTFPANITAAQVDQPSGPSLAVGDYSYRLIYEWTDNQGQIHRSAPSEVVEISVVAPPPGQSATVELTVPTPVWTNKAPPRDNARVVAYRTENDQSIYYRIQGVSPEINLTTGLVTIVDTTPDNELRARELLYTTGGELFNDAAPASTIMVAAKGRVFLANTEDGQLWYSKKTIQGEGVAFNIAQRILPEKNLTAIAELDDKIVLFEDQRIFVLGGDGPNALGQQNSFTPLQIVTSNVGCIDNRSIVEMAEGIMFKSDKGIFLLTRSLDTTYIGAPVEAFNSQTVTDATLVPEVNQVRFLTDSGKTLIYDYFFNMWGTWLNFEGVDSTTFRGKYVHLEPTGIVQRETPGEYLDVNASIPLRIETAWIKLAGVQGYQRIYRVIVLGDFVSPHTLLFKVAYDYQGFNEQILEFDTRTAIPQVPYGTDKYGIQTPYGGGADGVYQFRTKLCRQKCESIKFGFEDVASEGASFILSDLMMHVGLKRGTFKISGAKRI